MVEGSQKYLTPEKAIFDQKRLMVFCHQIVLLDSQFEDVWETKVQRLDELDIKIKVSMNLI